MPQLVNLLDVKVVLVYIITGKISYRHFVFIVLQM